jgi:uncharacterized protein
METPCPPGSTRPGCAEHPSAPVVARCVSCHRPLCSLCRLVYGNRNYCRSCLSAVPQPGAQHYRDYVPLPPPEGEPLPPGAHHVHQALPPGAHHVYQTPPPPPPPGYYPGYHYPPIPAPYKPAREIVFPGAPWGVGEAAIIFAIAYVAASAISFLIYQVLKSAFTTTTAAFLLIFLSSVVLYSFLLAGTFYSVKVRHRSTLTALGLKLDGLGKGIGLGFAVGVPLFMAAIFVAYVIQKVVGPTTTDQVSKSVNKIASGGVNAGLIALLVFTLVVLAPVCEEIFFRGYLYPALRNRMSRQPAMVLNGVLFAAAHFELIGFIPRALLGYGLCYIYERNKTLGGPITGHALYNGLVLLLSAVFQVF